MFKITQNKGFHMTFANGYTISVQFGDVNHCDDRDLSTAEVAIWKGDSDFLTSQFIECDSVAGYLTTDQVAELIAKVAAAS